MKHLAGNHLSPKSFQAKYFQSWSRGRQRWSYSWAEFCMGSFTSGKFCLPHSKRDYHIGLQKFNLHSLRKKYGVESTASTAGGWNPKKKEMTMYRNIFQWVWCVGLLHILNVSSFLHLLRWSRLIFVHFFWVKGEKTQSQVPLLSFQNFRGLVKCLLFFIQNPKRKTLNKTVPTWTPFFKWFLEPEIPRRPLWAWSMWLPPWQPKPTGEREGSSFPVLNKQTAWLLGNVQV